MTALRDDERLNIFVNRYVLVSPDSRNRLLSRDQPHQASVVILVRDRVVYVPGNDCCS